MGNRKTKASNSATQATLPENLAALSKSLKASRKLAILGIGSELMQDDRAGVEVTSLLEKKYGEHHPKVKMFTAYASPENFTSTISAFKPDHLLIIDAADLKLEPGNFTVLPVERIVDFSLGTHKLSLVMMISFLKETIKPTFSVLAIQYKSVVLAKK